MTTYYLAYWAEGWLEVIHHLDDVSTAFPLGEGVTVEPGRHKYTELWFNYQPPPGPLLRTLADARAGGFYDGWRVQLTVEPTWNLSRKLEIGGAYELNRIRFPDRSTGWTRTLPVYGSGLRPAPGSRPPHSGGSI